MSTGPSSPLPDPFQLGDDDSSDSSSPAPSPSPSPRPIQSTGPLLPSLRHQDTQFSAADSEVALDTTPPDSDGLRAANPLDGGLSSNPPTPPSKSPAPGFVPAPNPPVVNADGALGIEVPALCSPGLFLTIPDVSSLVLYLTGAAVTDYYGHVGYYARAVGAV